MLETESGPHYLRHNHNHKDVYFARECEQTAGFDQAASGTDRTPAAP